jgi:translation initiation factor 4G
VAAGSAVPTARSSYAHATKPTIVSSAAPPAVGGSQGAHHGKSSSVSPVNGNSAIKPAIPAMPTIVSGGPNGNGNGSVHEHSRKSSVQIKQTPPATASAGGPPSGIKFGSLAPSPAPAHATPVVQGNLNPQALNPRVASPAHSPSPIPAPISGGKPDASGLPTRPNLVFGGQGGEGAEPSVSLRPAPNVVPRQPHILTLTQTRPSMPPQPNSHSLPQAQHLRRESSQSAHSDMSNANMGRGFNPNRGRGGYGPQGHYNPQMANQSPQPYRSMPHQMGRGMTPAFQPPGSMQQRSPYTQSRSPAITPATMHQQQHLANPQGMQYPYGQQPYQQVRIPSTSSSISSFSAFRKPPIVSAGPRFSQQSPASLHGSANHFGPDFDGPAESTNTFMQPSNPPVSSNHNQHNLTSLPIQNMYAMPQPSLDPYNNFYPQGYGLQQSIHYPGPNSPGRNHGFPPQMQQSPYGVAPYGHQPQAQSMSRTPSNMSERPSSAVPQPSTPAMTNVNHISHTHTPSITAASPAPNSSSFERPKKQSKAIIIKTVDGEVVNFGKPKSASPAPPAVVSAPPAAPRSPAIAATPTPPLRAPSATDSTRTDDSAAKKAEFVKQFQEKLRLQEEAEKKAKEASEEEAKAEANAKLAAKEEADAKTVQEAKEKEDAEAAKKAEADEAEKKRLEDEETERMIVEMEEEERKREEAEARYAEEKKKKAEAEKANAAEKVKKEEERLRQLERDAEAAEAAKEAEQPAARAAKDKALFAGLKKNTMFGPGASQTEEHTTPAEPAALIVAPAPSKTPTGTKSKPAALKLDVNKTVEPAQPTAGMQALKSARFLQVREELSYPSGFASPNPALNNTSRNKGRTYDKDFLLQFQDVFKEKPSVDWDMKLKETVGDEPQSARGGPPSARAGGGGMMGGRQPSRSGLGGGSVMGQFQGGGGSGSGGRTLPPNTTSEQRFRDSQRGGSMTNPLAHMVGGRGGAFPMAPPMARAGSYQSMPHGGPNSPRVGSSRGKGGGGSRRGGNNNAQEAKQMPLTAGQDLKPLERSQTGWQPTSLTQPQAVQAQMGAGHLAPDMVQRKVKAALNKMTPDKFDKLSDQILEIAAQSKDETDGRTLRQVIQLTFEKACDESHWSSMYAKFCNRMLSTMSTDIKDENVRDKHQQPVVGGALFRKYLLVSTCYEYH